MMKELTLSDILSGRHALQEVARRERKSLDEVRGDVQAAISEMQSNQDPQVRARWAASPFAERTPSPEEFIAWCANTVREDRS